LYSKAIKRESTSPDNANIPEENIQNVPQVPAQVENVATDSQMCESGNYEKCYKAGKQYESKGTRNDYKKAFGVYKKSCEASHTYTLDACYALGNLYKNGLGVRRNYRLSSKLFDHVCQSNKDKACGDLGEMYLYGYGVKQNTLKAMNLLEKGCQRDNMKSCTALGTLYVTGEKISEDYAKAHNYFARACAKGDALACYNMGNIYENGIGRAQNMQDAKEFYRTACSAGLEESCVSLNTLK
jgi:TPR repeat protein